VSRDVLIVGGTGPTGVPLVERFLAEGDQVAIYHRGAHEYDFAGEVEHLHGDPRDPDDIVGTLGTRTWDVVVCTSGRLRALADHLAGQTGRLVGITGQPVYEGSMTPTPGGKIPLPVPEDAPRQSDAGNYTARVKVGEDQLLAQHVHGDFDAVIVRYSGVYGPRAPINHEWAVVRRVLDGRTQMAMPHDGMAYFQRGFAPNVAHLVYLCASVEAAAGEAFNAGDERVLSARHVAALICEELEHSIEFVGVPAQFCRGLYPMAEKSNMILDMSKARELLGYRDQLDPETATRETARWLRDNPPQASDLRGGPGGGAGQFDYKREDAIIAIWRKLETQAAAALDHLLS